MPARSRGPRAKRGPFARRDVSAPARIKSASSRAAGPALLALLLLSGCSSHNTHITFLNPQGPIALAERNHFALVVLMLTIVVVPVLVLTPFFARRYRYGNDATPYRPRWNFSWPIEFAVWGVPIGIVTTLGVWLAQNTVGLDPYRPLPYAGPPLRIQVIGYDWKWLFIYPDQGVASMGVLALPTNRDLAFELTSDTVLQSFFIPALGSQIYAMPGMVTWLHLQAYNPGRYRGLNTQYNGDAFEKQKIYRTGYEPGGFRRLGPPSPGVGRPDEPGELPHSPAEERFGFDARSLGPRRGADRRDLPQGRVAEAVPGRRGVFPYERA